MTIDRSITELLDAPSRITHSDAFRPVPELLAPGAITIPCPQCLRDTVGIPVRGEDGTIRRYRSSCVFCNFVWNTPVPEADPVQQQQQPGDATTPMPKYTIATDELGPEHTGHKYRNTKSGMQCMTCQARKASSVGKARQQGRVAHLQLSVAAVQEKQEQDALAQESVHTWTERALTLLEVERDAVALHLQRLDEVIAHVREAQEEVSGWIKTTE